ncbi:TBC1 domain family member 5-like isoform X2 [Littorina saxatilis]|uniref:TBC1 domain family member 5-like isoform X2 n=1 Tax=Littorina saxatilis TaxID=31220 RepID=UPI0038B5C579
MAGMFTRLKGGATPALPKNMEPAPTKEEILSSLEQFGENAVRNSKENNNNTKRRDSQDRENVDPDGKHWDMVDEVNEKNTMLTGHPHSYSMEWERHFHRQNYLRWLRSQAIAGELRPCRFRSICWRLFLEVLPEDMKSWSEKAYSDRRKYEELKNKLITNPRRAVDSISQSVMINNPLSQDEESPWNKFFQDNELRLTIKQDVIRTFPEIAFFRDQQMQDALIDVLFSYCREHDNISYKQGMHELLAPIIFVLHYDHQAFLHASETDNVLPIIKDMLDPKYLEHDAYFMFCQVMATVEPWYLAKDVCSAPKKKHDVFNGTPFTRTQDQMPSSVIVTKLTRIQDYLLKKHDMDLHAHLENLEIAPQIYGIRWLRLLFGREFPMQDLLMLWDAIFADGIGFDLVDYIFVAMMLYIRDLLLASDYAGCLMSLMKFPQVSDAHYFIDKALYLREPSQYPRPPNYCHQVTSRAHASSAKAKQAHQKSRGGFSSFSRKFSRPKTLSVSAFQKNLPKSSSEPMNLQTDISPASPTQNKRGSTVSLSQVEDSMSRQRGQSSASLGRLDPYLRSSQSSPAGYSPGGGFSPDEASGQSSPTKYASLPLRGKQKARKTSKQEQELQQQIGSLQGQLNDREAMCRYCASKLDVHIGRLQEELSRKHLDAEDEIMVSLAGIKLVRDVLNGTLRFSQNILDEDGEIHIRDNHYQQVTSPESDMADTSGPGFAGADSGKKNIPSSQSKERRQRMFYMSSGETSSAAESPESFNGTPGSTGHPLHLSDASSNAEYELGVFGSKRRAWSVGGKGGHSAALADGRESTAETSSQASSYAASGLTGSDNMEDCSPNPLYKEWAEDVA